mgnify:CR=1 FL=1
MFNVALLSSFRKGFTAVLIVLCGIAQAQQASQIYVASAMADITPKLPVALMGQFNLRVAEKIETPLKAGIVVIEAKNGNQAVDTAIFVSSDLVMVPTILKNELRAEVMKRIPGFNGNKIIVSATHTHTAPVLEDDEKDVSFLYPIPPHVPKVKTYRDLFVKNVADAIVKAWKSRARGSMTWGQNRAAVPYNRRTVYKDGTTVMYGKTDRSDFQNLEGYEDHDVNTLFFWDAAGKPIAVSVDVACPAQEVEHRYAVNADYWHPVREALQKKFGPQLSVLGWIGAAGDQSPHIMYRKSGEARMLKLAGKTRMDDIAERIVRATVESYEVVKNDRHKDIVFSHKTEKLQLPERIITQAEYDESKKVSDDCRAQIAADPKKAADLYAKQTWFADVLKRFDAQKGKMNPMYESEIHVLRIGDVAVCTNQFELFTDYGIRIQARSKALQTFVIQLTGPGTYLPTAKAVAGGGYSAVCQSSAVAAEGGQVLVDRTVELINGFWPQIN